jgi:RNA polymerase sigma-70 factor (ECF subfamily)
MPKDFHEENTQSPALFFHQDAIIFEILPIRPSTCSRGDFFPGRESHLPRQFTLAFFIPQIISPGARFSAITGLVTRKEFLVTRRSLVERLADWRDQKNWQEFFETYWKLIYSVAVRAGLSDDEAQDVVQETIITVAKRVDGLKYDPANGSFKGWLLHITRWRIADQFRRRDPAEAARKKRGDTSTRRTATIERAADPAGFDLEAVWDAEWKQNLLSAAIARVKRKVDARQYQIFDCYVMKEWPVKKITKELGVSVAQVYLAKHRVSAVMKKELKDLESPGK